MSRNKDIEMIHQITGWSYKESRRRYHENGHDLWKTLPFNSEVINGIFDATKSALLALSKAAEDLSIAFREAISKIDFKKLAEQLKEVQELGNLQEAECEGYISEECENCGRIRVEHYSSGHDICEKCRWCKQLKRYVLDDELYPPEPHWEDTLGWPKEGKHEDLSHNSIQE